MREFKRIVYEEMHFADILSGVVDKEAVEKEFLKRMPMATTFENLMEASHTEKAESVKKALSMNFSHEEIEKDFRGRAFKHIAFSKTDLESAKLAVDMENAAKTAFHNPFANLSRTLEIWKPAMEDESFWETYERKAALDRSVIALLSAAAGEKAKDPSEVAKNAEEIARAMEEESFLKLALLSSDEETLKEMKEFTERTGGKGENPLLSLLRRGPAARADALEAILAKSEKARRLLENTDPAKYGKILKENFKRNVEEIKGNLEAADLMGEEHFVSTLRGIRKELLYAYTVSSALPETKRKLQELMKEYGITLDDVGKEGVVEEKIKRYAEKKKEEFKRRSPKEYVEEYAKKIRERLKGEFSYAQMEKAKRRTHETIAESVYYGMDFNAAFKRIKEELSAPISGKTYRMTAQVLFDREFPEDGGLRRLYAEALRDDAKMRRLSEEVKKRLSERYAKIGETDLRVSGKDGDILFEFDFPKGTVRGEIPFFFGETAYLSSDFSERTKRFFRVRDLEEFRKHNMIDFLKRDDFKERLAFFAENRIPKLEKAFRLKPETVSEDEARKISDVYKELASNGALPPVYEDTLNPKTVERMRRRIAKYTPLHKEREDGRLAVSRKQFERFAREAGVPENDASFQKGEVVLEGEAANRWREFERRFFERNGVDINEVEEMRDNLHRPVIDHSVDRSLPKEELRKRNEIAESLETVKEEYAGMREKMMREAALKAQEKEKKEKERGRKEENEDMGVSRGEL